MIHLNPYLCEEANNLRLSLVHFGHATLGPWWRGKKESLVCSQIYYIVKGSAKVLLSGDNLLTMEAGNWYLLPSGLSVEYWCDDFMEEIYFHFKLYNIDQIDLLSNHPVPCRLPIREDMTALFLRLIESRSPVDSIRLQNAVYSILLDFIDSHGINLKKTELSPCVQKAVSYINSHLSMQLSVDEIVSESGVSKSTLEKCFKEELLCPVHEYLANTIMFEASRLLLKSKLSVLAISEQFGFCNQFYFSKRFKDKFGKSPKEFRNSVPM